MLEKLNLEDVLFLDIETVPQLEAYDSLSDSFKKHWDIKASFLAKNEESPSEI